MAFKEQKIIPGVEEKPALPRSRAQISARDTFASLRYPNYRLWFLGQLISLVGTWMQSTAQGYLVYELTGSAAYLGYVGFAAGIPAWLFTLYGGVIADRMPRRILLILTQAASMVLAFGLAALSFTGLVQPWHIILMAFLLGIVNAFDAPARQAFVLEMVDRKDLTNAIALNSMMFNSATAVGPAVAGLTYAAVGPAWCFTINGISFIGVIIALALMKLKPVAKLTPVKGSALADIKVGIRYVVSQTVVRTVILYIGVISLFGFSFSTLMPAWAVKILSGDATTNGFLQSARGVGSVIGALLVASYGTTLHRGKFNMIGSFTFPIALLVFAAMRWLPLSLLSMAGIGFFYLVFVNTCNSIVQTTVPDELRGRVMSIYTLIFFGLVPIGSLVAGTLASIAGEPATLALGAVIVLVFAGWVRLRVPQLHAVE